MIREQMTESRIQALSLLEHKPKIVEIMDKHNVKKVRQKLIDKEK